jgi:hypothetical protein
MQRAYCPDWIRTSDFSLRRAALYPLSYETSISGVRVELTSARFTTWGIRPLCYRAVKSFLRDSNSSLQFGRLSCYPLTPRKLGGHGEHPRETARAVNLSVAVTISGLLPSGPDPLR